MTGLFTISVEGPTYFSPKDEDVFYTWLNSISSIRSVGGVGTMVEITLGSRRIPQRDLRELIAIFHRYAIDKRPLAQLDRAQLKWFRDPNKFWYKDVFGRGS